MEILIYSKPSIPDRTDYILGRGKESPVKPMIEVGKSLITMGADFIAIPCITAHYFYEELSRKLRIPIIHAVIETVKYLKNQGIRSAGIMATEGTIFSGLFQEELMANKMIPVILDQTNQEYITELIYDDIKSNSPPQMNKFYHASDVLKRDGAEAIILGCTELSLIKRDYVIGAGFIDAMEVLSRCSILQSGAKLKAEYDSLLTTEELSTSDISQFTIMH